MNLYPILSPWASTESLPLLLHPFSGITPTHTRERGKTRTSFIHRHTFRENPSTSGVTFSYLPLKYINFTVYRKLLTTAFMEELNYSHPYMPRMKNKLLPILSVALIN